MSELPLVRGTCPSCGATSGALFVDDEENIICSSVGCPNPMAVTELLEDREIEHVVLVSAGGWTIRHPLRERIGDELLRCDLGSWLHEHHTRRNGPPVRPGRYRVTPLTGWGDADWEDLG